MNYNFSVLSDFEFQQLVNKLLTGKTRVVEQYAEGRDNGIDGLVRDIPDGAHIQAKHFLKSGFSKLKSKIENEEVLKIKNKGIACYVLATSLNLSQGQADSFVDCSALFVKSVADFKVLMQNGQVSLIGNLDSDTMDKVVLAAADSRHLNVFQKKFFDSAL